jgi:hypothetical protein
MRYRSLSSNHFRFLFLVIFCFCWGSTKGSAKSININDLEQYQYATFLYRSGEFYRAITEYKRLIHFFPVSEYTPNAIMQIGRSYMAGGELEMAIGYWENLDASVALKENRDVLLGFSYLDKDQLKVYSLREPSIEKGIEQLSQLPTTGAGFPEINNFLNDWQAKPEPDYKIPWLAGSMSAIIPGSGSMYTGRYTEGFYAFFMTALFAIATIEAIHQDEKSLSLVLGSFTIAFYGGNIYTAINSAYKVNDQMDTEYLYDLRQEHGIWFIPETLNRQGTY